MKYKSVDYKLSAVNYYLNYLSRSKKLSGSLDELPKSKFTRSAKGKPF
jgi:hypothetical protein